MITTVILWVIGLISTVYFFIYMLAIGLNNVFTYFWLIFGVMMIGAGVFRQIMHGKNIVLPKSLSIGLYFFTIAICFVFVVTEFIIIKNGTMKPETDADYVIVLGAQVNGTKVSTNLKYRLDAALDYVNNNPYCKVIVSGAQGSGEDITEAEAMRRYLEKMGVDASRIIKEEKSVNTEQNLRYSMEIISDKTAKTVIVSNKFHIYRAKKIALKQGYENVSGIGSRTVIFTIPNSYLREGFAVIKYKICGQI